jgi:tRNA threonylcarbamoyl adenosine modification protein YeaZ
MKILAVDTTGERLSLAFSDGKRSWSCLGSGEFQSQDEEIFPALERLLKKSGKKLKDIEALAVANGPGRFTGIRIGMVFASILGKVLRRPVVAVSRLEASARRLSGRKTLKAVCVLLPAKKDGSEEFYLQTFARKNGVLSPSGKPVWTKAGDMESIVGRGIRILLGEESTAADLIPLAREKLASGRLGAFLPLYLKPANFQR